MPYATREQRSAYLRDWYAANRERQIAAVTARRKAGTRRAVEPVALHVEGWQDRQAYALAVARRWYPFLFRLFRDDVRQIAALVAITHPAMDANLSRAMQRECYRLEKEIR